MDNGAKISQILMQRLYTDNARGFLTVPIYVNGTSRTNYSYLEFKSVSSIKWFFMLNTTDKKIDLGGTHSTDKIEILTSESNVRPVADEFLYVYNPDKHAVDENTISDTYYLINNGGIYKYLCEYDTNTTNLSCTASVIRSFTSPYNFSFAFPTNGSREAIIVDKNNTTYLFKPTTNEVIIGGKIDISPVTLSNNGIIITKDNMAYFAIPTVNALY